MKKYLVYNDFSCCAFYFSFVSAVDAFLEKLDIIYLQTELFSSKMERRCIMVLRLIPAQSHKVKALVHRRCCNCDDDHCLLLGEACIKPISQDSISCRLFLNAALPGDKMLHQDIIKQNGGNQ